MNNHVPNNTVLPDTRSHPSPEACMTALELIVLPETVQDKTQEACEVCPFLVIGCENCVLKKLSNPTTPDDDIIS